MQPVHEEGGAPHHLGVVLLPPSFGLTPPEEEGLKTTDGILKVRAIQKMTCTMSRLNYVFSAQSTIKD